MTSSLEGSHMATKNPTCSIAGCDRKRKSRGWCGTHYERWRINGDPMVVKNVVYASPSEAFQHRTARRGECLIWTGAKVPKGYGQIAINNTQMPVHRYAWEQANGPIPPGHIVDHICHNRACVNTDHLRLATVAQNTSHRAGANPSSASGIRNVYLRKSGNWQVLIGKDRQLHAFGTYKTQEEAARVAEQARKELFGEYAGHN